MGTDFLNSCSVPYNISNIELICTRRTTSPKHLVHRLDHVFTVDETDHGQENAVLCTFDPSSLHLLHCFGKFCPLIKYSLSTTLHTL